MERSSFRQDCCSGSDKIGIALIERDGSSAYA